MTNRLLGLVFALLASLGGVAWAGPGDGYYGHHGMEWGGWFMGPIMMIVFVALLVGGVILVLKLVGFKVGQTGSDRALDILRERFAKGEIDREEFEERRKHLGS